MNYKEDLNSNFKKPTNRYGVAPFWFLNGDLDCDELSWQVKEMKEKGLYGYVMHTRTGMQVKYFSEKFFSSIECIVKESEKLGMGAIIYDEENWPSGMCGGKLLVDHPEYACRQLSMSWIDCKNKKHIEKDLGDGDVVGVFAAKYEIESKVKSECRLKDIVNITSYAKNGKLVYNNKDNFELITIFVNEIVTGYRPSTDFPIKKGWKTQPDKWSWYFVKGKYVDLMNPDAVDYFLNWTHEEYRKRFEKYFGKAITHVFADEPGFYTQMKGETSAVPWTNKFPEVFKKEFDYDIIESLPALICDIGEKTSKARHDFWFELTKLFNENYMKKVNGWCKKNDLIFTGHFRLCFPQLVWQRNYSGNAIDHFREMGAPGVDMLDVPFICDKLGTDDAAWQIENKLVSSVGHQCNISRRMSESFALGGWDYRLADIKRVTDWQYMMGVNFIIPHAFFYSISGQRKRECPPSEFYQNPMWDNYKSYSDYICRLGEMMIDAVNIAEVAILYPMTSLWTDDVPKALVDDLPNNIDRDFGYITDFLLRENIDYDIIGEDEFSVCKVGDKQLKISDARYSLLLIPPMTAIRKDTEKKLREFIENGGKVIFLSMPPFKDNYGNELEYINNLIKDEFSLDFTKLLDAYKKNYHTKYSIEAKKRKNQLAFLFSCALADNKPGELIKDTIESLIERDFKIVFKDGKKGNLYYNHHKKSGKDIYFIHNSDECGLEGYNLEIYMKCNGTPYFYDPENGNIEKVYFYQVNGNETIVPYRIKPLGSIFIVFDHEEKDKMTKKKLIESNLAVLDYKIESGKYKLDVYMDSDSDKRGFIKTSENGKIKEIGVDCGDDIVKTLDEKWDIKLKTSNALIIHNWKMKQDEVPDVEVPAETWGDMFCTKQKYIGEFIIRGFNGKVKAIFDRLPEIIFEEVPQKVEPFEYNKGDVVPEPVDVLINGVKIENFDKSAFIDHEWKEVDITDLVKEGKNYIEIVFDDEMQGFEGATGINKVSMMWDPVYIIGDFALEKDDDAENEYAIVNNKDNIKNGSWAEQGYPYLSGGMEYEQEFVIDKEFVEGRKCFLDAGNNIREYMEVYINGEHVDTRVWLPFKVDITNYLKVGKNKVKLIIRNTPKNLLDKRREKSGVMGEVKIISKDVQEVCI